jgi:hypothetical protein
MFNEENSAAPFYPPNASTQPEPFVPNQDQTQSNPPPQIKPKKRVTYPKFILLGPIILIVIVIFVIGFYFGKNQMAKQTIKTPSAPEIKACKMDVKICPDGVTTVGRTGINCAFEECPESAMTPSSTPASTPSLSITPTETSMDTSTWKIFKGDYISFRYPSFWNPTKKELWGGEILEGVTLNIAGATDNQIGFSDVNYSSLQKPQDIVQESEILIGGRNGVKYIRKGDNYFTYDYLTYGKNDKSKSFGIHVTVSKENKNLENQLDQIVKTIKFTL